MTKYLENHKILAQNGSKRTNYPLLIKYVMNNSIIAAIFVAMVIGTGLTAAYVLTPSPAVLYEPVQGENPLQGIPHLAISRGR
jgi:hypothetical protein